MTEADAVVQVGGDGGGRCVGLGEEAGGEAAGVGGRDGGALDDEGFAGVGNDGGAGGDEIHECSPIGVGGDLTAVIAGGDGEDIRVGGGVGGGAGGLISGCGERQHPGGGGLAEDILYDGTGVRAAETEVEDVRASFEGGDDALGQLESGGLRTAPIDVDGENAYRSAVGAGLGDAESLEDGFEHPGGMGESFGGYAGGRREGDGREQEIRMGQAAMGQGGVEEGDDDRGTVGDRAGPKSERGRNGAWKGIDAGGEAEGMIGFDRGDIVVRSQQGTGGVGGFGIVEDQSVGIEGIDGARHAGSEAAGEFLDGDGGVGFEPDDQLVGDGLGGFRGTGRRRAGFDRDGGERGLGTEDQETGRGVAAGEQGEIQVAEEQGKRFAFGALFEAGGHGGIQAGFDEHAPIGGGGNPFEDLVEGPVVKVGVHAPMLAIPAQVARWFGREGRAQEQEEPGGEEAGEPVQRHGVQ